MQCRAPWCSGAGFYGRCRGRGAWARTRMWAMGMFLCTVSRRVQGTGGGGAWLWLRRRGGREAKVSAVGGGGGRLTS